MTRRAFDPNGQEWSAVAVTPEEAARVPAALPRHQPMPQALFDAWDDAHSTTGSWSPEWPLTERYDCCTDLSKSLRYRDPSSDSARRDISAHVRGIEHLAHRRGVDTGALALLHHTMWRLLWTTISADERDVDEREVADDPDWFYGYEWCGLLVQSGVPALRARLYRLAGLTTREALSLDESAPSADALLGLITMAGLRGNGQIVVRSLGCMTGYGSREPDDDLPLTALIEVGA